MRMRACLGQEFGALPAFFIDTWETIEKAVDEPGGIEHALARLVYLMPNVLFVITGRSQLTWADELRRVSRKYAGVECWPLLDEAAPQRQQILVGSLSPESTAQPSAGDRNFERPF